MTTLADINDTLIKNRQVLGGKQTYTSARIDALAAGFKKFTDLLEAESNADDLDALGDRDSRGKTASGITPRDDGKGSKDKGGKGRFFDFDLGNFLPLLGGLLSGFLKRGTLAIIAAMLADEVAKGVKNLTGSDILANVAEWATMGGAIGFLFGAKFGLIGAMLGALFSDASRTKIAETLSDFLGKEIKATDVETYAAAFAIAGGAALMPTLFKAALPALIPFLLSPTGIVIAALVALTGLTYKYFTDDEFKKAVDDSLQPLRDKITDFRKSMIDATKDFLDSIFDPLITTNKEKELIDKKLDPDDLKRQQETEEKIAESQRIRGNLFAANQTQLSDIAPGNQSLERIRQVAEDAGINLETTLDDDGKKLSTYDSSTDLFLALNEILMNREKQLEKSLEPIMDKRKEIEVKLDKQENLEGLSDLEISKRIDQLQFMKKPTGLAITQSDELNAKRVEKLQAEIDVLHNELLRRRGMDSQGNTFVDASTKGGDDRSTTVMPPSPPSANNIDDPVREAVVF